MNVNVPKGHLKPGLDGRRLYTDWARLLAESLHHTAIDIGTGPVAIHAQLLAPHGLAVHCTEIDPVSLAHARSAPPTGAVVFHQIDDPKDILHSLMRTDTTTTYDFCVCNPPFFDPTQRPHKHTVMTDSEGFYPGGEFAFCRLLIEQSKQYKHRMRYGTCLLGAKRSVGLVKRFCGQVGAKQVVSAVFCPDQTRRWAVAWTFNGDCKLRAGAGALKPLFMAVDDLGDTARIVDNLQSECDCAVTPIEDGTDNTNQYKVLMRTDKWSRKAKRSGTVRDLNIAFTMSSRPWSTTFRLYFDCAQEGDRDTVSGLISHLKLSLLSKT